MSDNLHLAWCRLLAHGLAMSGVREVVISPGSRSTPLVLGFDAEPRLRKHTVIDERSAAFFALGLARSSLRPVVLICTSGTAGAHYLPAIVEASQAGHPLIVLTADRPWEAYDCASSQTIDQVKLFGDHVRHYAELGLPERVALASVQRIAAQAVQRATSPTPGPVHINARFRKPLEPVDAPSPEPHDAEVAALLERGPTRFFASQRTIAPEALAQLAALCQRHERGLLVAGPCAWNIHRHAPTVRELSTRLGYPLCAEVTSQLRQGEAGPFDVPSFDALFRNRAFMERHAPGLIIELGGPPVSGAYAAWLAAHPGVVRVVLAPQGWSDPHGTASLLIEVAGDDWLEELRPVYLAPRDVRASWSASWVDAQYAIASLGVETHADPVTRVRIPLGTHEQNEPSAALFEDDVACAIARHTPAGSMLLVGNSGPIRDLDAYPGQLQQGTRVLHQRGAAGIDGWLAQAAGVVAGTQPLTSAMRGVSEEEARAAGMLTPGRTPVVLYLGDVAMLHDIGSLGLVADVKTPLAIVVVNNNGGRLFEQLPVGRRPEIAGAFERHFLTPHGLSFGPLASAWGIAYERCTTHTSLDEALARAVTAAGATIVEVVVDPVAAAARRRERQRTIEAAVAAVP